MGSVFASVYLLKMKAPVVNLPLPLVLRRLLEVSQMLLRALMHFPKVVGVQLLQASATVVSPKAGLLFFHHSHPRWALHVSRQQDVPPSPAHHHSHPVPQSLQRRCVEVWTSD
jgi:hypothetical protein